MAKVNNKRKTTLFWNEWTEPPVLDGFYLVWCDELIHPIATMYYDVFLARWTLEDDVFECKTSFRWTNFYFDYHK